MLSAFSLLRYAWLLSNDTITCIISAVYTLCPQCSYSVCCFLPCFHVHVSSYNYLYISMVLSIDSLRQHPTFIKASKCLPRFCLKLLPHCNLFLSISFMARPFFNLAFCGSCSPHVLLLCKPKCSPYHLIFHSHPFFIPLVISCLCP
jgi:hypothetical protein